MGVTRSTGGPALAVLAGVVLVALVVLLLATRSPTPVPGRGGLLDEDAALVSSGSLTVTEDGTVIDSLHVTGSISVQADDVTIVRSLVTNDGMHSIRVFDGAVGTMVRDTTVRCTGARTNGLVFGGYRAERVATEGCRNDFMSSESHPATVVDSTVDGVPFALDAGGPVPAAEPPRPAVPGTTSPARPRPPSGDPGRAGAATGGTADAAGRAAVISGAGPRASVEEAVSPDEARERLLATGLLERVRVTGMLDLSGVSRGYVVRDVVVDARGAPYGIRTMAGSGVVGRPAGPQLLEHVEVHGASSAGLFLADAVVRGADVWGSIDGIKAEGGVEVHESWLHDQSWVEGAHADAIQIRSGQGQLFSRNVVEARYGSAAVAGERAGQNSNAGLQTGSLTGEVSARFLGNWWDGGHYAVRMGDTGPPLLDYQFRDNRFGRTSTYGPVVGDRHAPSGFGGARLDRTNVWDDDGDPLP